MVLLVLLVLLDLALSSVKAHLDLILVLCCWHVRYDVVHACVRHRDGDAELDTSLPVLLA